MEQLYINRIIQGNLEIINEYNKKEYILIILSNNSAIYILRYIDYTEVYRRKNITKKYIINYLDLIKGNIKEDIECPKELFKINYNVDYLKNIDKYKHFVYYIGSQSNLLFSMCSDCEQTYELYTLLVQNIIRNYKFVKILVKNKHDIITENIGTIILKYLI